MYGRLMRSALGLLLAGAILIVLAQPAAAAGVQLPVGQADGVRIVREHGAIVVVFGPSADRLWRRVAGRRVEVMCEKGPDPDPDDPGTFVTEGGGTTMRAPKRGRRLRTGDLTRGMDICEVSLPPRTVRRNGVRRHYGRRLIVSIPLSQRGAVRLDERARTQALVALLSIGAVLGSEGRYATSAELVAQVPKLRRPPRLSVVELAGPADTPPAGSIGYYSDGAQHAAAVVLSASGRRLFFEADVDRVIRTNVSEYVYGDD
jgi:hypothetical protein